MAQHVWPATPPSARRPAPPDGLMVVVVAGLLAIGLLLTFTASHHTAYRMVGDGTYFFKRQVTWVLLGTVAALAAYAVPYGRWRRYSVPAMLSALAILTVLLGTGATRFGGERWLLSGGSVQPSELAKLAVILYIADWLAGKREAVRDAVMGLVPFSIIIGLVCGLILLQPDYSTAALVGAVALAMFFTAGADTRQMVVALTMASVALIVLVLSSPYRLQRLLTFLDPAADPSGAGYQVRMAKESFMTGGVLGVGLGSGQQKLVLPTPHTDAVFSVLGEELGLLGCLAVLAMFAVLAWRGFRVAAGAPDRFGALLATGITVWILAQALINMAVVTGFIPFTGMPLPFLSYGGSSLVVCLVGVGVLLNISKRVQGGTPTTYAHLGLGRRNSRTRLSRAHRARSRRR